MGHNRRHPAQDRQPGQARLEMDCHRRVLQLLRLPRLLQRNNLAARRQGGLERVSPAKSEVFLLAGATRPPLDCGMP